MFCFFLLAGSLIDSCLWGLILKCMKRRKFFETASYGAAGLLMSSCCSPKTENKPGSKRMETPDTPPSYRNSIKSSFTVENGKSINDKLIVGVIGMGGYGNYLTQEILKLNNNIHIKYVCDVDDTRGGKAIVEIKKVQGNNPIRVRDMRVIFDDKEVDAVFITTPQHWHALATIWACQAGKDVYVEKCISYDIYEGQKMIEAAMKYERVVQCGTQNRSAGYVLKAQEYINSGELGDLVSVHIRELDPGPLPFQEKNESKAPDTIDWNLWLGPAPEVPYSISRNKSWGYYWDYSGGLAMSNGINHQLDMARLILNDPGFPKSVYCTGGRYFFDDARDIPDYQMATFDYGKFVLTLETGECTPYLSKASNEIRFGEGFPEWKLNSDWVLIQGTKRMMYVGRMGGGWQVFDKGGEIVAQEKGYYPIQAHLENFIDCVRSRKQTNGNIVEGHHSAVIMHLANMSYRAGCKQLLFDPETETILNDKEANRLIFREYRKGFEVPRNV